MISHFAWSLWNNHDICLHYINLRSSGFLLHPPASEATAGAPGHAENTRFHWRHCCVVCRDRAGHCSGQNCGILISYVYGPRRRNGDWFNGGCIRFCRRPVRCSHGVSSDSDRRHLLLPGIFHAFIGIPGIRNQKRGCFR